MNSYRMHQKRNESVLASYYHDAFIHTEDEKIFSVHKVMIAMYSPFLHKYFQSRPGYEVNDVFFQGANSNIVKSALELIYNGTVSIETNCIPSIIWFLKNTLQVDVQEADDILVGDRPLLQTNEPEPTLMHGSDAINEKEDEDEERHSKNIDTQEDICTESSMFASAWTLTSISEDMLEKIRHSEFTLQKKGRQYKCNLCTNLTKTYEDASNHFTTKHQTYDGERKQIESATNFRKECLAKICNIKKDVEKGCNIAMANSQLEAMSEELTSHLDILSDLGKIKLLTGNITRRTRELCLALSQTIKEIEAIIKLNDNK